MARICKNDLLYVDPFAIPNASFSALRLPILNSKDLLKDAGSEGFLSGRGVVLEPVDRPL